MHDIETLIVGAGVVGLAVARALAISGQEVVILEQHGMIGTETSSRNSEVVHAGIYYPKGSLKARTCIEGKKLLYEFCASHGVPHKPIGKLIVATNEQQDAALGGIGQHAIENGVSDLLRLDRTDLKKVESALNGVAALYSPSTGIVDTHAFMLALLGDSESCGCQIAFNTRVAAWRILKSGGFEVECNDQGRTIVSARNLIVSCGLHTSKFLNAIEASRKNLPVPKTRFAKGNYFRLSGRAPFSHLIYPVPEPGGLGVHLTLDLGGQARFGPDVEWVDDLNYDVDQNRSEKFYAAIRSYWPDLLDNALQADYSGIRPKLVGMGEPDADFLVWGPKDHGINGLVGLLGIESPGLTSSLALANYVAGILNTVQR